MNDFTAEILTRAIDGLTAELRRYNDANTHPVTIYKREPDFGKANYIGREERAQKEEFLARLGAPVVVSPRGIGRKHRPKKQKSGNS